MSFGIRGRGVCKVFQETGDIKTNLKWPKKALDKGCEIAAIGKVRIL